MWGWPPDDDPGHARRPSLMTPNAATLRSAPRLAVLPARCGAARRLGEGLVARARLVRRLTEVHDIALALLVAPAGYGKTTTLLEWAQHDERPFAWVALHRADDEAEHLRASVARATDPLTGRGREFVLVLDDVQVLRSRGAIDVLTALVEDPPAGAQLVLASRCEPPLPLGRLRAHRQVLELTPRDFVMTRGEAAALLELAGAELAPADVDTLVRRTEGWPAGLYLAAVSLRDQPDTAAAIARFGGDDRVVSDYVADSLLSELTAEEVTFLQRTSVLDRLSGPLCDAVLLEVGLGRAAPGPRAGQRPGRPPGPHRRVVPLPRSARADAARAAAPARARARARAAPAREPLARRPRRRRRRDPPCRSRGRRSARGRSAVDQRLPLHPAGPQRDRPALARSLHRRAGGRATRRWRSWPPTPIWPTATAITPSIGPPRPHARSTACRPGAGRRQSRPASRRCAQRSPATACSACATMPRAPTHSMRTPALRDRWIGCSRARRATCSARASAHTRCWRRDRGAAWSARRASTRCASPSSRCWRSTATTGPWPPSSRPARARRSSASGWRSTRR